MALNCFYLRPSADISIGHTLHPTDSPNAYSLLNDYGNDDDKSTYIGTAGVVNETVVQTSSFKMSGIKPSEAKNITNAVVKLNIQIPTDWDVSVTINGELFELNKTSILSISDNGIYTYSSQSFTDAIKEYGVLSDIIVTLTSSITTDAKVIVNSFVFSFCIEVEYSTGINRKVNGEWKPSGDFYKKINGTWTKIDNGYSTVGSTLHKSGHHQEYLKAVTPTCTETGLTEGYKCSICGEFFVPQQVIPANGHSYIPSGGHRVCTVCDHVEGLGFVELVYHGTATALSVARNSLAATTVGNYALFGGGYSYDTTISIMNGDIRYSTVDAYDTSLTRTIPTDLSVARSSLAATTVGNYALFGGGYDGGGSQSGNKSSVDAYDTSLTRTIPTDLSVGRQGLAATTVGNYALFGGGSGESSVVDAYDTSLTRTIPTALSKSRSSLAATTVGNYALFGGGGNTPVTVVDAYDTSLTRTIPTPLTNKRQGLAATTVGNYALFGGGHTGGSSTYDMEAYDTSLTKTDVDMLHALQNALAATTVGNYALFGGGVDESSVTAYDHHLTKTIPTELSNIKQSLAATRVGNYALFGGGGNTSTGSGTRYSTVDVYKIQPKS